MAKRLLPSFIIIGERKCGTSSLYRYLLEHPQILPCKVKEPQFFSRSSLRRALTWHRYRRLFPPAEGHGSSALLWYDLDASGNLSSTHVAYDRPAGLPAITGEASANTFAMARPRVVRKYLPDVHLILLARDPVDRAFSHHRMLLRFQEEGRNLPRKVLPFENDLQLELENFRKSRHTLYLEAGIYVNRLKMWRAVFYEQKMHVFLTEEMATYNGVQQILDKLFAQLGLEEFALPRQSFIKYNKAARVEMGIAARQRLSAFYAPWNEAFAEALGRDIHWSGS